MNLTVGKSEYENYTDENGDEQTRIVPQGIDQSKLVPLLTAALQEAVNTLSTKIGNMSCFLCSVL